MKLTAAVSLALAVFAVAFAILLNIGGALNADAEATVSPSVSADSTPVEDTPSPTLALTGNSDSIDGSVSVKALIAGNVTDMDLRSYLIGVVAAEMPVSFNEEALKAQAVAARTYTMYKILVSPSENHPEADVCDDPACCKAYASPDGLKDKWGGDYDANIAKITEAVDDTDGQCLLYGGEPALAVFHSSSAGMTEDSGNVWGSSLPYLKSVETPESADTVPNYVTYVTVSVSDFSETVLASCPDADLSGAGSTWISGAEYTDSGRLASVNIGGDAVSGTKLRDMFGLRSAAITIEADDENIKFTVTGYGHGVGMSQYGANVLADEGYGYDAILNWYYDGTEIGSISSFF